MSRAILTYFLYMFERKFFVIIRVLDLSIVQLSVYSNKNDAHKK
jgi:hypothetical protein